MMQLEPVYVLGGILAAGALYKLASAPSNYVVAKDGTRLSESAYMTALFRHAGFSGPRDVREFQAARGLQVDGIIGPRTLWELQAPWAEANVLGFERLAADKVAGYDGYDSTTLRADVGALYAGLLEDAHKRGAVVTSAGGRRSLGTGGSASRSGTSLHYWGGAFDLSTVTGMQDPTADPYVLVPEPGSDRRWRVWARAEGGRRKRLEGVRYRSGGRLELVPVEGRFIDFTALAQKHGFSPIGARSCWPGNYLCAEWWHFQANRLLFRDVSQFGAELLRAGYSEARIKDSGLWPKRMWRFGRDWN